MDDLTTGIPVIQLLFQIPVQDQGDKACDKVGDNPFFPVQIDWAGLKFALHNPEAFFDFPPALIHSDDGFRLIVQTGADRIKPVIHFFLLNCFFIKVITGLVRNLSLCCRVIRLNKTFGIILPFVLNGF